MTSAQGQASLQRPTELESRWTLASRGWVFLFGILSAVALVAMGVVIAAAFSDSSFALVVLVVAAIGLGSNFA